MIRKDLLDKIAEGDKDAIAHFKEIVKWGAVEPQEIDHITPYIVKGILSQNGLGSEGAKTKIELFFLNNALDDIGVKATLEQPTDLRSSLERIANEDDGRFSRIWINDYMIAVAMKGPQSDFAELDNEKKGMLGLFFDNVKLAYAPVISLGAMSARARKGEIELDQPAIDLIERCLYNALLYGNNEASKYAYDSLQDKSAAKDYLFDSIWKETGETRTKGIEAILRFYNNEKVAIYTLSNMAGDNADISVIIGSFAKESKDEGVKNAAGLVMAIKRQGAEMTDAVADREFLLETEYPDPTSAQRMFVEIIFDAIGRVYDSKQGTEFEVAMKQLTTYGTNADKLESVFQTSNDRHNLRIIMRNVENALLHAFTNYDGRVREQATAALVKIGGDRVESVLEKIVARTDDKSVLGISADNLLAEIRGKEIWKTMVELPAIKRTTDLATRNTRLVQ